jgi:hypothetical protein
VRQFSLIHLIEAAHDPAGRAVTIFIAKTRKYRA